MVDASLKPNEKMKKTNDITQGELADVFKAERSRLLRYACYRLGNEDDAKDVLQDTFTKNDGLLRFVKLWVIKDGKKTLLLHIDNIRYNVMLCKADITRLPAAEWTDVAQQQPTSGSRLELLQNETAQQAAERILNAIIAGDESQATEALIYHKTVFPQLTKKLKGCKVSAFEARKDSSYAGVYVLYTLTTPDGKQEKRHIALRNDNEQHIWILDGGL
jgi:DNA-directed RNA polymerase specialized sigma24 family protein